MSEPINNLDIQEPTPGEGGEVTFTQAQEDALISKEKAKAIAKAQKGMPNEEELTAFRAWKDSQQTEQEKWENLKKERDESKAALTAAEERIQSYEREKYLISKGIPAEDVDYYSFKIGKLVDDETTFEKAADKFLNEHSPTGGNNRYKMSSGAPLNGGAPAKDENETMNALIRGFRK